MRSFSAIFLIFFTIGCTARPIVESSPSGAHPPSHSMWTSVLQDHVTQEGNVDYVAIAKDSRFEQYLTELEGAHPDESWSKDERLSYWINAYNAFTVKLINDNWPVESIKDISRPWAKKFVQIENSTYSLNDIEHEILRKKYEEPRIHFAINCASYSCPVLLNKAFEPNNLDQQLTNVTKLFINDKKRNKIGKEHVELSKIFDWFKGDFTKGQSLLTFINIYSEVKINTNANVSYLKYNWNLNK